MRNGAYAKPVRIGPELASAGLSAVRGRSATILIMAPVLGTRQADDPSRHPGTDGLDPSQNDWSKGIVLPAIEAASAADKARS